MEKLLEEVSGKDISEILAEGLSKLAAVPSGGGGGAVAAAPAAAAGGGGAAKEEKKEEKKKVRSLKQSTIITFLCPQSQPLHLFFPVLMCQCKHAVHRRFHMHVPLCH